MVHFKRALVKDIQVKVDAQIAELRRNPAVTPKFKMYTTISRLLRDTFTVDFLRAHRMSDAEPTTGTDQRAHRILMCLVYKEYRGSKLYNLCYFLIIINVQERRVIASSFFCWVIQNSSGSG